MLVLEPTRSGLLLTGEENESMGEPSQFNIILIFIIV